MNQKNTSFGLANMNGISDDSGRSCALSDMNCRKGQPEQSPSLQDMNAANAQPDRTCSLTNMNCRRDWAFAPPVFRAGLHISLLCRENQQKGGA